MTTLETWTSLIELNLGKYEPLLRLPPRDAAQHLCSEQTITAEGAVLQMLANILAGEAAPLDPARAPLVADWMRGNFRSTALMCMSIVEISEAALEAVLLMIGRVTDDSVALVVNNGMLLHGDRRSSVLMALARDPRAAVRIHLFSLLNVHRRLVPPGTLDARLVPDSIVEPLLARGIGDEHPEVRERAIAYAYGLGVVARVREQVLDRTSDDALAVRCYALVALGVLDDSASFEILVHALGSKQREETKSAIWALARRVEGFERLLPLVKDPDLAADVLGAVAEVSAPLDDVQLDLLATSVDTPALKNMIRRHIERTRHGAPERGPDSQVDYFVNRDR